MFKSKVLDIYDYRDVNISCELLNIKIDQSIIGNTLNEIAKKYAVTVNADDAVKKGDQASIEMESNLEKFNRKNVPVVAGMGLFNKVIEEKLIGMKKDEVNFICIDGNSIKVKVQNIKRKIVPEVTDEMIVKLGISGVSTVDEYRKYCFEEELGKEKEKKFEDIYEVILDEVLNKSKFSIENEDIDKLVECELNRCREVSKEEGMVFDEMTREQWLARVPAGSLEEFKEFLREKHYNISLKWALIAMKSANEEKVIFDETTYNESLQQSAAKYKTDVETEMKLFPFLNYILYSYSQYLKEKIRKYYDTKFICA